VPSSTARRSLLRQWEKRKAEATYREVPLLVADLPKYDVVRTHDVLRGAEATHQIELSDRLDRNAPSEE
jgi:hypothetical protein